MSPDAHRAGQAPAPSPPPTGRPAHVVAVLADSAEAVRVARAAGELAAASGHPLAIIVPVPIPAPSFTVDPFQLARDSARISQDAAAVAGRVSPTLDRLGLPARVFSAPYRTDVSACRSDQNVAAAVEELARRLRAVAVVISASSPVLPHLHFLSGQMHLIEPALAKTPTAEAHPILDEDRVTGR